MLIVTYNVMLYGPYAIKFLQIIAYKLLLCTHIYCPYMYMYIHVLRYSMTYMYMGMVVISDTSSALICVRIFLAVNKAAFPHRIVHVYPKDGCEFNSTELTGHVCCFASSQQEACTCGANW